MDMMVLLLHFPENTPGLHMHSPKATIPWLLIIWATVKATTLIQSASSKALYKLRFCKRLSNNFAPAPYRRSQNIKKSFLPRTPMVQSSRVSSPSSSQIMAPTPTFLLPHPTTLRASVLSLQTPMPNPLVL
jgi:hypothetical protein